MTLSARIIVVCVATLRFSEKQWGVFKDPKRSLPSAVCLWGLKKKKMDEYRVEERSWLSNPESCSWLSVSSILMKDCLHDQTLCLFLYLSFSQFGQRLVPVCLPDIPKLIICETEIIDASKMLYVFLSSLSGKWEKRRVNKFSLNLSIYLNQRDAKRPEGLIFSNLWNFNGKHWRCKIWITGNLQKEFAKKVDRKDYTQWE